MSPSLSISAVVKEWGAFNWSFTMDSSQLGPLKNRDADSVSFAANQVNIVITVLSNAIEWVAPLWVPGKLTLVQG